jgi:hypothetical protein
MGNAQLEVLFKVLNAIDELNVTYLIGGSFASSTHGFSRATMDIDLLAAINREQATKLISMLGPGFYADELAIRQAIDARRHFNLIHIETGFKVDVFVAKTGGFDERQLERRLLEVVMSEPERKAYLATPEDTIIAKLNWYRRGDEISDRQWQDVIGIIKVQGVRLDLSYLRDWAKKLDLSDLLEKALAQGDDR